MIAVVFGDASHLIFGHNGTLQSQGLHCSRLIVFCNLDQHLRAKRKDLPILIHACCLWRKVHAFSSTVTKVGSHIPFSVEHVDILQYLILFFASDDQNLSLVNWKSKGTTPCHLLCLRSLYLFPLGPNLLQTIDMLNQVTTLINPTEEIDSLSKAAARPELSHT